MKRPPRGAAKKAGGALTVLGVVLALGCNPVQIEQDRRRLEAGADTPEALASIEAHPATPYGWSDW